ncbi:MAG: ATP synthase subunit b [Flavobacteriales bacterium]|nr:MAG: F0F1 ATP synthase subunit B [Flavobacteriales bacterium]CAI8251172.1 MAG: ATP synthase subunit b [Flavobacteriales bacterium]|tara:strand:- start:1099 stop:1602 length:504 start_codon:yes stop_codon:yes gene_type:complete
MEKLLGEFSFGLFIWQTVIVTALILLLRKFAWKPILNTINDREEGIRSAMASAEEARQEMQNLQADNERILKEARAQRDGLLKEARELRQKMIDDAKEEAKAQSEQLLAQAKEAIEGEKQIAITSLKNEVADLSLQIAESLTKEQLSSDKKQTELVQKLLKEVDLKA